MASAAAGAAMVEQAAKLMRPRFCHAVDYLRGLQLAEYAGYTHPRGIQRVLDRYAWDDLCRTG